ncbi:MAG: hypothetical protein Q9223_002670 [Gallowayella weberi]
MNDEPVTLPRLHDPSLQPSHAVPEQLLPDVDVTASAGSILPAKDNPVESNAAAIVSNHVPNLQDRSDSEAETVVLDGKQDPAHNSTHGAVKSEQGSQNDNHISHHPTLNGVHSLSDKGRRDDNGSDRPSLKRKRATQEPATEENLPSSNLTSTVSSPGAQAPSPHRSNSWSDHSRSTPPLDEDPEHRYVHPRKRKITRTSDGQDRKKRGKSDPNSVPVHRKGRRETRSANHHDVNRHRSESLPSRRDKRALSGQSTDFSERHKRKRVPPPLLVDRQRKASEDTNGDSDDSSSLHSHPHLQKVASAEQTVMSPAKISYKKNRDRNGRTLLARACAMDINEARKWLKERPQDIDIPDHAGNTPLQIASLEGLADVVQILLDARCDINCKNVDMETPLIDAVENGHLEVVQLLLNAGLDPRQSNHKGEEPLDLVNPNNDDYEEIRKALMAAKEKNPLRRASEDHSAHVRDNDMSSLGASAASPTDGQAGRSPPPPGPGARRRTARSQHTQDSLLWVNPTPAKLREACGKGDLAVVDYILKMRPEVGTDAVIAAARAGHDVVLEILFAIGQLEHDPDPVESGDFKPGRDTPMLAAIGRGHIPVIRLLVSQRGFNPTRRIFRGLTYHELAKERQGSNWEEEYAILKEAYEDFKINGGRRSNHGSPRRVRARKPEGRRSTSDISTSPSSTNKRQLSLASVRTAPEPEIKQEHSHKAPSNKHLRIPEEIKDSAILSDRDSDANGRADTKRKAVRSVSDAGVVHSKSSDTTKPRRKLLSRNDLNSDQDIKRRASHGPDASSHEQPRRDSGDLSPSVKEKQKLETDDSPIPEPKLRKESSKDGHGSRAGPGKKRPRLSTSPHLRGAADDGSAEVGKKKKKKRRVDSEGNAVIQDPQACDTFVVRAGPAMVANMIASPEPANSLNSPSEPPSKAPVANMGVSTASPITRSPTEITSHSEVHSPMSGIESTLQQNIRLDTVQEQVQMDTPMPSHANEDLQQQGKADKEAEDSKAAKLETERLLQKTREDERAREEEQTRLERQRQADEAAQQARREEEEEAARVAKKQREEEMAMRRAEQDRLRREEQERRIAELEERDRLRRIRLQEEEQRKQREALPNSLRRAAELSPEKARQAQEIKKWLPLYTVTTREIFPDCDEEVADERWIANVQAAPILAIRDLDLSQYTALDRKDLSKAQRQSLWRQVRNLMSQANINPLAFSWEEASRLDAETYPKFHDLKSLFWIRLSEFMDIVPRHAHLVGIKLRTRAMVLHDDPWGKRGGGHENGISHGGGGGLVNGF